MLALTGAYGHLVGYLEPAGVFIPPPGGASVGDWIVRWCNGQPALETMTEKVR